MSKQKKLIEIIKTKYRISRARPDGGLLYNSQFDDEFQRIYLALGGVLHRYPTNIGFYDVFLSDFAIELDEERHFNRYRNMTLDSIIYDQLPNFPLADYNRFCSDYEVKCLRAAGWGGYWFTASSDRQFGLSNVPGNLDGNGSSRWKQRAFYDFLKDTIQLINHILLIRISIYDKLETFDGVKSIDEILSGNDYMNYSSDIIRLIELRY